MFCENVRQQLWHPALNRVRVALDERADTKNGGVELTHGGVIHWGFLVLREFTDLDEADEAILQGENTPAWRQTQDARERAVFARAREILFSKRRAKDSRRGHLAHLDDLVVETPTDYLHHLDQLRIADEE